MSSPLVLIVDDSDFVRKLLRKQLERHGFRVNEAADGVDALAHCREDKPDVMVLDEVMPRLSGRGVLQRLQAEPDLNQIPVLFLTSNENIAAEVRSLGAAGCVIKGKLSSREFKDLIGVAIDFHARQPELDQRLFPTS